MNDRDKHLSLAIDALTILRERIVADLDRYGTPTMLDLTEKALRHVETAAEMPQPSRIRSLVQRIREAA